MKKIPDPHSFTYEFDRTLKKKKNENNGYFCSIWKKNTTHHKEKMEVSEPRIEPQPVYKQHCVVML